MIIIYVINFEKSKLDKNMILVVLHRKAITQNFPDAKKKTPLVRILNLYYVFNYVFNFLLLRHDMTQQNTKRQPIK